MWRRWQSTVNFGPRRPAPGLCHQWYSRSLLLAASIREFWQNDKANSAYIDLFVHPTSNSVYWNWIFDSSSMGFSKYSSKRSSRHGRTLTISSQSMGYTNNLLTGPLEDKQNIFVYFFGVIDALFDSCHNKVVAVQDENLLPRKSIDKFNCWVDTRVNDIFKLPFPPWSSWYLQ